MRVHRFAFARAVSRLAADTPLSIFGKQQRSARCGGEFDSPRRLGRGGHVHPHDAHALAGAAHIYEAIHRSA